MGRRCVTRSAHTSVAVAVSLRLRGLTRAPAAAAKNGTLLLGNRENWNRDNANLEIGKIVIGKCFIRSRARVVGTRVAIRPDRPNHHAVSLVIKASLPKTVLIIEDDNGLRLTLAEALKQAGYQVSACATAEEGLEIASALKPTLVFCDVHLEPGDGRTILARLREDETLRDCQFVLMTGDWVGASQRESIDCGADAYLAKPFSIAEFITCAEARYEQANL